MERTASQSPPLQPQHQYHQHPSHHVYENPEEHEKEKNQKHVKKRERQWQIVDSDDEAVGDGAVNNEEKSDDGSHQSSQSEKRERLHHHTHNKRQRKDQKQPKESKHKDGDDSSVSSADSSDSSPSSDSSSASEEKKSSKKHKKHRKKHSSASSHKKDKKKDKKHHKDKKKKEKKSSKKKRKGSFSSSHDSDYAKHKSIDQNEYGKYGIIREEHFFQKQREFEAYMAEVRNVPGVLHLNRREMMEHFRTFMEDYNTATMPHTKYYNYERWEMEEYQKKGAKERQQRFDDEDHGHEIGGYHLNDEEEVKRLRKRQKEDKERQEFDLLHSIMKQDKSIQEDMKRQAELRTELNIAHKRGDMTTVKRLERLLAPDDPSHQPIVKHPWS